MIRQALGPRGWIGMRVNRDSIANSVKETLYRGRTILWHHGVDVGRSDPDSSLDAFLTLLLFPFLKINCVIDVGASRGEFGRSLRHAGYDGHIISFEPVRSNFTVLQEGARSDRHWKVYPYALGSQDTTAPINVMEGSTFHSFLQPSAYGLGNFGRRLHPTRQDVVEMHRLDNLLDDVIAGVPNPVIYLKLDTQGYDLEVLRGAEGILPRVPALQTEIALKQQYEGTTSFSDTLAALTRLSYDLSASFAVYRDAHLALSEMDAVFVRQQVASEVAAK